MTRAQMIWATTQTWYIETRHVAPDNYRVVVDPNGANRVKRHMVSNRHSFTDFEKLRQWAGY